MPLNSHRSAVHKCSASAMRSSTDEMPFLHRTTLAVPGSHPPEKTIVYVLPRFSESRPYRMGALTMHPLSDTSRDSRHTCRVLLSQYKEPTMGTPTLSSMNFISVGILPQRFLRRCLTWQPDDHRMHPPKSVPVA